MAEFEEDKFFVLKRSDIDRLPSTYRGMAVALTKRVEKLRREEGRDLDPRYYVCNRDEPYAMDVLNMILRGEEKKERNNE